MSLELLQGLTVINTRPLIRSEELHAQLDALAVHRIHLPAISIVCCDDFNEANALRLIEDSDMIIVTSANTIPFLTDAVLAALQKKPLFAVGRSTASCLKRSGCIVSHYPEHASSQALLDLPELRSVDNKRILICCGEDPKPLLKDMLQQRGALVNYLYCYRRINVPSYSNEDLMLLQNREAQVVLSFSLQSLQAFFSASRCLPRDVLSHYHFVVINQAMRSYCLEQGCSSVSLADSAMTTDVVNVLQTWWYKFREKQLQ